MADRIPLIVNPGANQIQELPTGDELVLSGQLKLTGTSSGDSDIELSGGADGLAVITVSRSVSNMSKLNIDCRNNANSTDIEVADFSVGASNAVGFKCFATEIDFTNLPTSDPAVAGRLWRSGNDVKISTG